MGTCDFDSLASSAHPSAWLTCPWPPEAAPRVSKPQVLQSPLLVPGQVWARASRHQDEAKTWMWARLKVKSCFPSMKYLLLPWKPLQGVCSPSPNQCPPTRPHSLSPGPHGDLNAPGWSRESISHTLTKMCRLRVEGLFSITIWNILALFPELIIALGKAFPPKYSPRNQLEMNWEVWNTDFLGKESPCQGEGWIQAYVSWLCQGYKWTLKVTKSIHTFASLLSPTSIDIWF